jgi:hypothetical protein
MLYSDLYTYIQQKFVENANLMKSESTTHKHVLDGYVKRGSDVVCLGHCHSMISTFGRQCWVISTFSGLTRTKSVHFRTLPKFPTRDFTRAIPGKKSPRENNRTGIQVP